MAEVEGLFEKKPAPPSFGEALAATVKPADAGIIAYGRGSSRPAPRTIPQPFHIMLHLLSQEKHPHESLFHAVSNEPVHFFQGARAKPRKLDSRMKEKEGKHFSKSLPTMATKSKERRSALTARRCGGSISNCTTLRCWTKTGAPFPTRRLKDMERATICFNGAGPT